MNARLENLTHNHELNSRAKMFSRNATALNALDKREIYLLSKSNVKAAEIARYINETTGKYISNKQAFNNLALSSCSNLILLGEINQLFSLASSNEDKKDSRILFNHKVFCFIGVFFAGRNVLIVSKTNLERFAASPELLLVDTTFGTNNFNAPVAVFASKDATDMVYIVALATLSSSTTDSFKWALSNVVEAISPQTASQVEVLFTDRKRAGSC